MAKYIIIVFFLMCYLSTTLNAPIIKASGVQWSEPKGTGKGNITLIMIPQNDSSGNDSDMIVAVKSDYQILSQDTQLLNLIVNENQSDHVNNPSRSGQNLKENTNFYVNNGIDYKKEVGKYPDIARYFEPEKKYPPEDTKNSSINLYPSLINNYRNLIATYVPPTTSDYSTISVNELLMRVDNSNSNLNFTRNNKLYNASSSSSEDLFRMLTSNENNTSSENSNYDKSTNNILYSNLTNSNINQSNENVLLSVDNSGHNLLNKSSIKEKTLLNVLNNNNNSVVKNNQFENVTDQKVINLYGNETERKSTNPALSLVNPNSTFVNEALNILENLKQDQSYYNSNKTSYASSTAETKYQEALNSYLDSKTKHLNAEDSILGLDQSESQSKDMIRPGEGKNINNIVGIVAGNSHDSTCEPFFVSLPKESNSARFSVASYPSGISFQNVQINSMVEKGRDITLDSNNTDYSLITTGFFSSIEENKVFEQISQMVTAANDFSNQAENDYNAKSDIFKQEKQETPMKDSGTISPTVCATVVVCNDLNQPAGNPQAQNMPRTATKEKTAHDRGNNNKPPEKFSPANIDGGKLSMAQGLTECPTVSGGNINQIPVNLPTRKEPIPKKITLEAPVNCETMRLKTVTSPSSDGSQCQEVHIKENDMALPLVESSVFLASNNKISEGKPVPISFKASFDELRLPDLIESEEKMSGKVPALYSNNPIELHMDGKIDVDASLKPVIVNGHKIVIKKPLESKNKVHGNDKNTVLKLDYSGKKLILEQSPSYNTALNKNNETLLNQDSKLDYNNSPDLLASTTIKQDNEKMPLSIVQLEKLSPRSEVQQATHAPLLCLEKQDSVKPLNDVYAFNSTTSTQYFPRPHYGNTVENPTDSKKTINLFSIGGQKMLDNFDTEVFCTKPSEIKNLKAFSKEKNTSLQEYFYKTTFEPVIQSEAKSIYIPGDSVQKIVIEIVRDSKNIVNKTDNCNSNLLRDKEVDNNITNEQEGSKVCKQETNSDNQQLIVPEGATSDNEVESMNSQQTVLNIPENLNLRNDGSQREVLINNDMDEKSDTNGFKESELQNQNYLNAKEQVYSREENDESQLYSLPSNIEVCSEKSLGASILKLLTDNKSEINRDK